MHACIHTYVGVCVHKLAHGKEETRECVSTYKGRDRFICIYLYIYIYARIFNFVGAIHSVLWGPYIDTCMHAYIYVYIHTYIRIDTCMAHMLNLDLCSYSGVQA